MEKVMTPREFYENDQNNILMYIREQRAAFVFSEAYAAYRERIIAEKAFEAGHASGVDDWELGEYTGEGVVFCDWWKEREDTEK